jgi:hypothetical protein
MSNGNCHSLFMNVKPDYVIETTVSRLQVNPLSRNTHIIFTIPRRSLYIDLLYFG